MGGVSSLPNHDYGATQSQSKRFQSRYASSFFARLFPLLLGLSVCRIIYLTFKSQNRTVGLYDLSPVSICSLFQCKDSIYGQQARERSRSNQIETFF